jgi:hypothetical protein
MTDPIQQRKKTPNEASDFEREQLRFLLSGDDVATTLAAVNPSLAWLPILQQMRVVRGENQLVDWIERNFSDTQAIRDVVANIRFFGPETASFLEYRLNRQAEKLPPLLLKCWRLIVRYMKSAKYGALQNEWFEIQPQVLRGEHSAALLERIAETLRPKLKLAERFALHDEESKEPQHPSDLMSIEYEVDDGISANDVLEAWPVDAIADTDSRLLDHLSDALAAALDDAIDVGVESNAGYSASDADVPSVAEHRQNSYHAGFQVIVRVIAEVWSRLTRKSESLARPWVRQWLDSDFRLMRRLALFACADPSVSGDAAADALITLPRGELFVTNSTVEVHRLIRKRWQEFPIDKQRAILDRLQDGPPTEWFREGAEIEELVDRCRFDILGEMQRQGFDLGAAASLLNDIRSRWPEWKLRPEEQAGFHMWHESGPRRITGDADKLDNASDKELVPAAKRIAASADFLDGDHWQTLCLSDPDRALRGLSEAAADGDWTPDLWQQLLWARKPYASAETRDRIAQLLVGWPAESFDKIAGAASSWLNEQANSLDDALLWPLWDRIAEVILVETIEAENE